MSLFYKRETVVPYNGQLYKFTELIEKIDHDSTSNKRADQIDIIDLTTEETDQTTDSTQTTSNQIIDLTTDNTDHLPEENEPINSPEYEPMSPANAEYPPWSTFWGQDVDSSIAMKAKPSV